MTERDLHARVVAAAGASRARRAGRGRAQGHLRSPLHLRALPRRADQIAADAGRELPPLPAVAASAGDGGAAAGGAAGPRRRSFRGPAPGFVVAAAAAAFALVIGGLGLRPHDQPRVGGRASLQSRAATSPSSSCASATARSPGNRPRSRPAIDFKLLVTCPPPLQLHADIVVLQSDGPAFPGEPAVIACGNRVPVAAPFRITGPGPATVCVAFDPSAPPSRAALSGGDMAPTTARTCLHLDHSE